MLATVRTAVARAFATVPGTPLCPAPVSCANMLGARTLHHCQQFDIGLRDYLQGARVLQSGQFWTAQHSRNPAHTAVLRNVARFCSMASQPCARDDAEGDAPAPASRRSHKRRSSLRSVPGVGPKNEQLLVSRGFSDVSRLLEHFTQDVGGDTAAMISYLQTDVGIRMRRHAGAIASHLRQLEKDSETPPLPTSRHRADGLTVCVEGNISAGKSTFLKMLDNELIQMQQPVQMVPEPVDQWQNVGGKGGNMLQQFYSDPQRYAYTFQNYVFITRVMQEQQNKPDADERRLIERSVFSDRMVFVRAVHDAKWMSELELNVYDSWFEPIVSAMPSVIPDGFIYLRANPGTCLDRMTRRSRSEEAKVSLDYLEQLHQMHEDWLRHPDGIFEHKQKLELRRQQHSSGSASGRLLDAQELTNSFWGYPDLPPELENQVYLLERGHQQYMHPSADGVPALVLDYDEDIDLERDVEAKRSYAVKVSSFFAWVRDVRNYRAARNLLWSPENGAQIAGLANIITDPAKLRAHLEGHQEAHLAHV